MQRTAAEHISEFKSTAGPISIDEKLGIVECFAAAIGNKDSVGDIIIPGAFDKSLKRRNPRVVWGHDWNHPIGKVLEIYEVKPGDPRLPLKMKLAGVGGLYAKVQFNLNSEKGREAFHNIMFFDLDQEWSIGYKTHDAVYDQARQANILRELELYEISPVLHGANQLTATISIKDAKADMAVDDDDVTSLRASKWKMFDPAFAAMIKAEHPDIWALGGNIKGNEQYRALSSIHERDGKATSRADINALNLREAWVARHHGDFRIAGVIAQIKWLAVGSRGEAYMKDLVRSEIAKRSERNEKGGDQSPLRVGGLVRWNSSGGTSFGKIVKRSESDAISAEPDGPQMRGTEDDPAFGVQVWQRSVGGRWVATEVVTVHRGDALTPIDALPEQKDGAGYPSMDVPGYKERLTAAIEAEHGGSVMVLQASRNLVVFAHRVGDQQMMMQVSYHFDGQRFMIGDPERVKPVFVPVEDGDDEGDEGDDDTKIEAGVPQERITGDVMRGYGPRRGNLERLLRYWRPIMKRPGGFRRCLVILADHPELYPLPNMCAWLHHETTGKWPNEGKRRVRKDAWYGDEKSWMGATEADDVDYDEDTAEVTDDDITHAYKVLNEFMESEKGFMSYLANEDNWEGDDEDDDAPSKGGCGCGCSGRKSDDDDLFEKAGRVLSNRNLTKIRQALDLLTDVVGGAQHAVMVKDTVIGAPVDDLFALKSHLDPVFAYHGMDVVATEEGLRIKNYADLSSSAREALNTALDSVSIKSLNVSESA